MKEQFTGALSSPSKRLEAEGQIPFDFDGSEVKKPRDFYKYSSQDRIKLSESIRDKQVKSLPLTEEENDFVVWGESFKEEKGNRWN